VKNRCAETVPNPPAPILTKIEQERLVHEMFQRDNRRHPDGVKRDPWSFKFDGGFIANRGYSMTITTYKTYAEAKEAIAKLKSFGVEATATKGNEADDHRHQKLVEYEYMPL